jgi:hypothetical protein
MELAVDWCRETNQQLRREPRIRAWKAIIPTIMTDVGPELLEVWLSHQSNDYCYLYNNK